MTKRTALYNEHVALRGRMVEFAGWEMPVMYSSILDEHHATRKAAALFDVSHMGEIAIQGDGARRFIQGLIPTSLDKLVPMKAMYSVLLNEKGGVIDDLFVYMISPREFLLVVNAGTIAKDLAWLKAHAVPGVEISDLSSVISKIDIQGPLSKSILSRVISWEGLEDLERFRFGYTVFSGVKVLISHSGYTGEDGYEIYIENATAVRMWRSLLDAGRDDGLVPAGLGARDTLRLESSYSLYGHELSDDISPVEAGLSWLVNASDDYTAKHILATQKKEGAARELVCLELTGRGVPREGYEIERNGNIIGVVTSGAFSPTLQKGIAMALVERGSLLAGDAFDLVIRGKKVPAIAVKRPFYKYHGK